MTLEELLASDASWREDFNDCLKAGVYKALHRDKMLTDTQLDLLLAKLDRDASRRKSGGIPPKFANSRDKEYNNIR